MKKEKNFYGIQFFLLVLLVVILTGCGMQSANLKGQVDSEKNGANKANETNKTNEANEEKTNHTIQAVNKEDLYLITEMNEEGDIRMYRYNTGKEYGFSYTQATSLLDKYGNRAQLSDFYPGRAVYIGDIQSTGEVTAIEVADEVWEYDNISRYSFNSDQGIFTIADSKYRIQDNTFVFSNGKKIEWSDVEKDDTLFVVGKDKTILSVIVTTGHGTLQLKNTKLFEGSYLQLGKNNFTLITENMAMDVQEGTYELSVENNGWGGSCEVTIMRGQVTEVDLDTLKGDGPKYGNVKFVVDVQGAVIKIDGKIVDYRKTIKLTYGEHDVTVSADGFDTVKETLYVNSEKATLEIKLNVEKETEEASETQKSTSEDTSTTEKKNKSDSTEKSTETSSEKTSKQDEVLSDYVSTITKMLDSF